MDETSITSLGNNSTVITPETEEIEVVELKDDETPEYYLAEEAMRAKVEFYGDKWGLSKTMKKRMAKTILCENPQLDPKLQSNVIEKDGNQEDSWGIVQIHLPDWPEITKQQAQNEEFSLNFMAQKFSEGKQRLWSCYKQIYK